ncbi:AfsR/SARP family transcriptional regulator [Streptomyces sp. NL15-2K]|uniref:AfsR/SARP family transcriptional regulator n=1 Tax=Streptomyces sp. NL15-2K TaxID=376149 RepID=UPI000F56A04B|nr:MULTISPECIES: AfsR/SARP family transcriptional regulator [Actinomycetes]WKX10088.1 BTAD domain-containing putative transcriptional regulator [Kutzneria buriramensis]
MEFRVLGPVEAVMGGERVALSGSKIHTVLAALLLSQDRVVSDARLSSLLWGWEPPATASAQIYTYMSRLRKQLGEEAEIVRRPPGYVLRAPGARVDLVEFRQLERDGRRALAERRFEEASELLRRALRLWRGAALANVTEHMLDAELAPLEEKRMLALESRIEADLELGRHEQVTAELTGLVAGFPVRERLRAQLMTALYRCGRQADALHAYYEGRKVLAEQLGIDPGEVLGSTYQAVLGGELGLGRAAGASSGRAVPVPSMLPATDGELVGRQRELDALRGRLGHDGGEEQRRILVTGMAGIGKTALAVRAAAENGEFFPDGLLYAELCGLDGAPRAPRAVLAQLLRALGEGDPNLPAGDLDELVRLYRTRTAGRRLLLVLDNVSGDRQLAPLLPAGPSAVLITSRRRLARVTAGDTFALPLLDDEAGLDLLAARAGRQRLLADPDASDDLVAYCGGLPLALAIAGARLAARPHWTVARLAGRLADPATRLAELSFGDLDLSRVLGSSMEQLEMLERTVLGGLAETEGEPISALWAGDRLGLSEDAAENALESLVDAALLELSGLDDQGRPLYRCHELVRLLAAARPQGPGKPERAGQETWERQDPIAGTVRIDGTATAATAAAVRAG